MNIAFHYIYRDGANYKNFNTVIFKNNIDITIEEFKILLKTKLICEEYFYAEEWKLPDLHFGSWEDEFDHDFHSFEDINYTNETPNAELTMAEFLNIIKETDWV